MQSRFALKFAAPAAFAALLLLGSCSEDESTPTGPSDGGVSPLTADYWPLPIEGATWSYVRVEDGVFSPDTIINYFNLDLPAAYTDLELLPGFVDVQGQSARVLRSLTRQYPDKPVMHGVDLWLNPGASAIELLGEDISSAIDSSYAFMDQAPYSWIRFGQSRWVVFEVDYSGETMNIAEEFGYGEDRNGKVVLGEALGFDYPRIIYDGSNMPGNFPFDLNDVDHDTYPDGIAGVRLVGEVVAESDLAYADLGSVADSLFPDLKNTVFKNCKWVRFSLEADLFLSNQRDPNAAPGQNSINEVYISKQAVYDQGRRDLGLMALAPDLGPVAIINYIDMDKQLRVGDPGIEVQVFQPDLIQTDYLAASSLLP